MSWVALADLVDAIRFVIDDDSLHGAVNVTSPNPVTNREFTQTLGKAIGRPTLIPMPAFALRTMVGRQMADEMLLGGAKIHPHKLTEAGFTFDYPTVDAAISKALAESMPIP
jgi:NAD dependent epimerase/dehydratase family enzyme